MSHYQTDRNQWRIVCPEHGDHGAMILERTGGDVVKCSARAVPSSRERPWCRYAERLTAEETTA